MNDEMKCEVCDGNLGGGNLRICASCRDDGYVICNDCEGITNDYEYIESSSSLTCRHCIDTKWHYYYCARCNNWFDRRDTPHYDVENECFCDRCIERIEHYSCDDCGDLVFDAHYHEGDDTYYCNYCIDSHPEKNGIVKSYHSTKSDTKFKGKNNLLNPLVGFELEIESTRYGRDNLAARHEEALSKFRVEEDGSLNDGFEIISHAIVIKNMQKGAKVMMRFFVR